jgi:SAM-dependent methyltransferase
MTDTSPTGIFTPAPGDVIDVDALIAERATADLAVDAGAEWRVVNDASIDEYMAHHGGDQYPDDVKTHMTLFAGFIAKHLLAVGGRTVIDVGCGVGTKHPLYIREMAGAIRYVGLDPIKVNLARDYAFVCGRLEDLAKHGLSKPADVAVFATSLDHFEDARAALRLAASLVDKGRVLLWVGLHDSAAVSASVGARAFARACDLSGSPLLRMGGLLGYTVLRTPRLFYSLYQRERSLARGERLDKFHFHYFLREELLQLVSQAGAVIEFVQVPGSNSAFVALTPHPEGDARAAS